MNQTKCARLKSVIARYAVLAGAETKKAQAERALIEKQRYVRRLDNPGTFTLDELENLSRAFKIPWSEIAEALT